MNAWHDLQTPPPEPGRYWCANVWRKPTGDNHRVEVHYADQRFRLWTGSAWDDADGVTHWYGEVKHGNNI